MTSKASTPFTYDVAIIGAGVAGCTLARELARFDLNVCVFESGIDIAPGATRANSAIVHAGYDPKPSSKKARYNVEGSKLYPMWAQELGFSYKQTGSLVLAFTEEECQTLQELEKRAFTNGVPGVRVITAQELFKLEPNVSREAKAALLAPTGAICDPYEVALYSAEQAANYGCTFIFDTKIVDIKKPDTFSETYELTCEQGEVFSSRVVVNAAGVFADEIHNLVSEDKLHISPRRGDYVLYDTDHGSLFSRTMFQAPTRVGKGVLVTPTVHGNLLVGPNAVPQESKTLTATSGTGIKAVMETAKKTWPELSPRGIITNFAGLRASGNTGDFVIGEVADAPGFYDIACFESPGLTSAPAVAVDLSQQIAEALHAKPRPDFNPVHTSFKRLSACTQEKRNELIKKDPAYGRIVCRCCKVSEAELVSALKSPIPVRSIDALKWRCRAMMGACHGGFCSPEIIRLMVRETGIEPVDIDKRTQNSKMIAAARPDYTELVAQTDTSSATQNLAPAPEDMVFDVLVVGGGAAGIAAAISAVRTGARKVALLDREERLGGILKQCVHNGFGLHRFKEELTGPEYASRELAELSKLGVVRIPFASVLSLNQKDGLHEVELVSPLGAQRIKAISVVLATGSRERGQGALNMAGTRPSGVYTAGCAQSLMNLQGCLPGKRIVILGSGDIGLITARRMSVQGAKVLGVYELMPYPSGLRRNIVQCLDDYDIPLHLSRTVTRLEGEDRLTAVYVSEVDPQGLHPIPGTEKRVECDTLLLSVGLLPESGIAKLAGVELSPVTGGACVNQNLETSIPGIFTCGNALHIHDLVDFASAEGERAGMYAARRALAHKESGVSSADSSSMDLSEDTSTLADKDTCATKTVEHNSVIPGNQVRYVVPQHLDVSDLQACSDQDSQFKISFRVQSKLDHVRFTIEGTDTQGNTSVIKAAKALVAIPAEMVQMTLNIRDLAQFSSITVHAQAGE